MKARARQVVDMQHLGFKEPAGRGRAYYLQDVRAYGGNDAYWLTEAGGLSTQIREAAVFTHKAALEKQRACETLVLRRKSIVDRHIGLSVQAKHLDFRDAHLNSGFFKN